MATEPTQSVFRHSYGADKDVLQLQAIHQAGTETVIGNKGFNGHIMITTETPTLSTDIHKPTNLHQAEAAASNPCSPPQPGGAVVFEPITRTQVRGHSRSITTSDAPLSDARREFASSGHVDSISSHPQPAVDAPEEHGNPRLSMSQKVPPEIGSLLAEIVFVMTCTAAQVVSSLVVGHITVTQIIFREALGIPPTQAPWLIGSSALASGLSVIISGSLADLNPPKPLMIGAFLWGSMWNAVTAVVITPKLAIMFFIARAMNGLAVGVLVTTSMSILGRVYKPGIRKTRVFSFMAAGSPLGFWIGCIQGGALCAHLPWIFGSTSIFLAACAFAAHLTVPALRPANDSLIAETPSLRQFDYAGAFSSSTGCALILFGLTQGSFAHWNPYTYCLILLGLLVLVGFYHVEKRVARPIVPKELWQIRGFVALLVSYFLGQGAYNGAWQFYAIQFWQRYQGASPLTVALYLLPNAIVGVLAAWLVSKTLHVVPGRWIFTASMVCFALGPVFFLPQAPDSKYWALSMPGVALATFGPDMSFAAAAIFITSSVPRSYQGSAGSLLVTVQSLSTAVMTSISDSIGTKVDAHPNGEIGLDGIRAIWWFGLASALVGALITAIMVRIPKAEEKEHVQ